jgi:hypothetical protein
VLRAVLKAGFVDLRAAHRPVFLNLWDELRVGELAATAGLSTATMVNRVNEFEAARIG